MKWTFFCSVSLLIVLFGSPGGAEDSRPIGQITDTLTICGVIAGAYQYENPSSSTAVDDIDRGALPIRVTTSIKPSETDEFFFKFGFAVGNGLNTEGHTFVLAPWAAGLEDDVKNINGRTRDYLLTAWYAHTFTPSDGQQLTLIGGIIDTTDYLDDNAYANCEYTQFMNAALVNGANVFLPSYDIGGAIAWEIGRLTVRGVMMQVGENDEGKIYNFYGVQMGYTVETPLGKGTYRLLFDTTSDDFTNVDGTGTEPLKAAAVSFDQALGEILGVWLRCGWSDDKALVGFKDLYSGGINILGKLWGRDDDNIGIGYAHLSGGNIGIDYTQVAEAYVRFAITQIFALTFDVQYLNDHYKKEAGTNVDGWITGVRLTAEF